MKDDALPTFQLPATDRPPADDEYLARLRAGDRAALEELVRGHHAIVARLVHRLAGYSTDTEDLVQEVFFRATRSAGRFDARSSLSTWLSRIAINVCRTHHRRRFFRKGFWARWSRSAAAGDEPAEPHARLDAAERGHRVRTAVAALPFRYRQVVVLHYLEQHPIDAVARLLKLSKGATEVRLHRARRMLEQRLHDLVKD